MKEAISAEYFLSCCGEQCGQYVPSKSFLPVPCLPLDVLAAAEEDTSTKRSRCGSNRAPVPVVQARATHTCKTTTGACPTPLRAIRAMHRATRCRRLRHVGTHATMATANDTTRRSSDSKATRLTRCWSATRCKSRWKSRKMALSRLEWLVRNCHMLLWSVYFARVANDCCSSIRRFYVLQVWCLRAKFTSVPWLACN